MAETASLERQLLAALPRLDAADLSTGINSLELDAVGRHVRFDRDAPLVVTFRQRGRLVTGRFDFGASVSLEVGCRLARIPDAAEGALAYDRLLATIRWIQGSGLGRLALGPERELHLRDRLDLSGRPLGAAELVHALLVAGLALQPVLAAVDELGLPQLNST